MRNLTDVIGIRRMKIFRSVLLAIISSCLTGTSFAQNNDDIKLKDYRPVSIYKVPVTKVSMAKYPAIDVHVHPIKNDQDIALAVNVMNACGIEKAIVLTGAWGARFDSIMDRYSKYGDRFELWCGFDITGYDKPGYGTEACKELERCYKKGAKGVGELMYKGKGVPPNSTGRTMMLPDDPRVDILFEKCAELHMPVNLHVSEDKWMYEKIDATNDGLMNASKWQVKDEYGTKSHEEMIDRLENTIKKHPNTIFIAAHLANCCVDLSILGKFFDTYPNLYADMAARHNEISPIPRFTHDFFEKYQDRIVYGTDQATFSESQFRHTLKILESSDEHFYDSRRMQYHSPLYGLYLSDATLKKLYRDNFLKIMKR